MATATPAMDNQRRWWILVCIGAFAFMSNLDASIVNIAMPVMSRELAVPLNQIEWVVSIYLIVLCALLLFFGQLGDMVGKLKVFKVGTVIFIVGSFMAGLNISFSFLLLSRVIQAVGSALTLANTYGIVTTIFPIKERGRAMGFVGTFVALGGVAGPGLGGVILNAFSWQYIFWINVPIGIVAVILGLVVLPHTDIGQQPNQHPDWWGFITFAGFIVGVFAWVFLGQDSRYTAPLPLTLLVAGLICLGAFFLAEHHAPQPLIPVAIFKIRPFSFGVLAALILFMTNFFTVVIMPFYLEDTRHLSAGSAGLLLITFPVVMTFSGPFGGYLADKFNQTAVATIGLIILGVAQSMFIFISATTPLYLWVAIIVCMGIGNGMFQSPNSDVVMSVVPKTQLGIAGSLNAMARNVGMVTGTALATTTLFWGMSLAAGHRLRTYPTGQPGIFMAGFRVAFIVSTLLILIAIVLSLTQRQNMKGHELK